MQWVLSKLAAFNDWLAADNTIWTLFVLSALGLPLSYLLLLKF